MKRPRRGGDKGDVQRGSEHLLSTSAAAQAQSTLGKSRQSSRFLTGSAAERLLWACIDEQALFTTSPIIADRRFAAYVAPFKHEEDAHQAFLDAGADPSTIVAEQRRRRHVRR